MDTKTAEHCFFPRSLFNIGVKVPQGSDDITLRRMSFPGTSDRNAFGGGDQAGGNQSRFRHGAFVILQSI
jgi:hypothetical protein